MSNFEVLQKTRKNRPDLPRRIAWLEDTIRELQEYHARCPKCKRNMIKDTIIRYETLADNLTIKFEVKGV